MHLLVMQGGVMHGACCMTSLLVGSIRRDYVDGDQWAICAKCVLRGAVTYSCSVRSLKSDVGLAASITCCQFPAFTGIVFVGGLITLEMPLQDRHVTL